MQVRSVVLDMVLNKMWEVQLSSLDYLQRLLHTRPTDWLVVIFLVNSDKMKHRCKNLKHISLLIWYEWLHLWRPVTRNLHLFLDQSVEITRESGTLTLFIEATSYALVHVFRMLFETGQSSKHLSKWGKIIWSLVVIWKMVMWHFLLYLVIDPGMWCRL